MNDTLAVILAGGKGTRLEPLTRDRAKPAVPFGGAYRIVDFVMSNCINSGFRKMLVLTQYKAMSLDRHLNLAWRNYFCSELGETLEILPPQQRIDEQWYRGTADAVYQNIYAIEKHQPEYVVILAGDHIYKMNYETMVAAHRETGADLTIGALPVSPKEAREFGVMQVDSSNRIVGFEEKPSNPKTMPGNPDQCLASMGIYVFSARFLYDQLCRDAIEPTSHRDFGKNIIPSIIDTHQVQAFPFKDENAKGETAYWRDVGTLAAYYEANMDLISIDPVLNMYDNRWPIRTLQPNLAPPKFAFGSRGDSERVGMAIDSIVCSGAIVSGGRVQRSILSPRVRVNSYAQISDSILFDGVDVGRHCRIRNAIIDKGVRLPEGTEIGFDEEEDRRRGFVVSPEGLVVIAKTDSIAIAAPSRLSRVDAAATAQNYPAEPKYKSSPVKQKSKTK